MMASQRREFGSQKSEQHSPSAEQVLEMGLHAGPGSKSWHTFEQHEEEGPAAVQGSPATVQLEPAGWTHVPPAPHAPVQQAPGSLWEHDWPVWMHWPALLHAPPSDATATHSPPEQAPEQHCGPELQGFPLATQLPPSFPGLVPPSAPPPVETEASAVGSGSVSSPQLQPEATQANT